jgi:hypothetical protein
VRSHAVAGALTVDRLFAGTTPTPLTTLSGETLTVDSVQRTINGAHVITPDTGANNGVVHTIDRLLVIPTVHGITGSTTSGPECEFTENDELPIQRCDAGPAVAAAQSVLQALEYDLGTIDCLFGDQMLYAVQAFQADEGLTVSGMVDEETWAALEKTFLPGWCDDANGNGTTEPNEITLVCG